MNGWRHTRTTHGTECADCWDEHIEDVCLMADPDPASPCGFPGCLNPAGPDDELVHCDPDCGPHTPEANGHPHVPTRCTCGHAIEKESHHG